MKFRIQERTFEDVRQWKSPRSGWRSVNHYSRWKTVASFDDEAQAKKALSDASQTGLKQHRLLHGRKIIAEGY